MYVMHTVVQQTLLFLALLAITLGSDASEHGTLLTSPIVSGNSPTNEYPAREFSQFGATSLTRFEIDDPEITDEITLFRIPLLGSLEDVGFRYSSARGDNFDGLTQKAFFVDFRLPWSRSPSPNVSVTTRLTLEAGQFEQQSDIRRFASFGPTIRLANDRWRVPFFVEAGIAPTVIDGSMYNDVDFGTSLNITSYLAFGMRLGRTESHVIKLRYQHISNVGINDDNPGVNMVGIDIVFWARRR